MLCMRIEAASPQPRPTLAKEWANGMKDSGPVEIDFLSEEAEPAERGGY